MLRLDQHSVVQLGPQPVSGRPLGPGWSPCSSCCGSTGLLRGSGRICVRSLGGTSVCWTVKRIFRGHFPTSKAGALGGALEVDIMRTVDNPSSPDKP